MSLLALCALMAFAAHALRWRPNGMLRSVWMLAVMLGVLGMLV
ncbi:hypothetical protein [Azospirillum sp. TSO22-1]|nr:hypothetical protein [Azospirillum sp. TSO22-1]